MLHNVVTLSSLRELVKLVKGARIVCGRRVSRAHTSIRGRLQYVESIHL